MHPLTWTRERRRWHTGCYPSGASVRRPDVAVGPYATGRPSDAYVYRADPATEVGADVPRGRTARGEPAVRRGIVRRHVAVPPRLLG